MRDEDRRGNERDDERDSHVELPRDPSEESRVPTGPGTDPAWDRGDTSGPEHDPNLDRGGPTGGVPKPGNDPSRGL